MIAKEQMAEAILRLPDGATADAAVDCLLFINSVERGMAEADAGNVVSQDEVERRMAAWLE